MARVTDRKVFPVPDPDGPEYRNQCLAVRDATWGKGVKIGAALGYRDRGRTVQHWGEPDHVVPSPIWDAYVALSACVRFQEDSRAALRPLHWLCESLGGRLVAHTETEVPESADGVLRALAHSATSFGEWMESVASGAADGRYNLQEITAILEEARQHLEAFYRTEQSIRAIKQRLEEEIG